MEYEIGKKYNFSKEDVDNLKNLSKNLASRAVKKYLIYFANYIAERDGISNLDRKTAKKSTPEMSARFNAYKKLLTKLEKIETPPESWCEQFSISGVDDFHICFQLAIVPAEGYEINIRVPPEQRDKMFRELDNLTNLGRNYYIYLLSRDGIMKDLGDLVPDIDVSNLSVQPYNRTMYLDEKCGKRIGVMCYYVDNNGQRIEITDENDQQIKQFTEQELENISPAGTTPK